PVGASLLAKVSWQSTNALLTLRFREQARSHKLSGGAAENISGTKKPRIKRGFFLGVSLRR
ncbi:hypothetical protein ACW9H0_27965, partial [Pseudomonas monsensis]